MKNTLFIASALVGAFALASCGGTDYDPNNDPVTKMYDSIAKADSLRMWGPPTAITFAQAMDTGELDQTRVTIEGYIGVGSSVYGSDSYGLDLWERKGQVFTRKGEYISVSFDVGSGNNQMKSLPSEYKTTDLELKDDKGNVVRHGDKIKITGIYREPYMEGYGSIDLQTFEKVEDTPLDYSTLGAVKVTADTNGHAALDGKVVMAEGYLEIPSMIYITETVYFDLYATQGADEYLTVDIVIGNGPNMVENMPDNYTRDDIKIHDHSDMIVGRKKVRVYGVWKYDRIAAEYIEIL